MKKIDLSGHEEEVIERLVSSGRYTSPEQAIKVSVRLLDEHEAERGEKLERLREDVAAGMADVREGRVAPFDAKDIKREGRKRYDQKHPSA